MPMIKIADQDWLNDQLECFNLFEIQKRALP